MTLLRRWNDGLREFALVLRAFVEGRSGVLDDHGRVVEASGDYVHDPSEEDFEHHAEDEMEDSSSPTHHALVRVRQWLGLMLVCAGMLLFAGWSAWQCWRLSGWIGRSLLHVPGPVGNVVGGLSVLGVIAVLLVCSSRLERARSYRRACNGNPSVADRRRNYHAITTHARCPACMYAFDDSQHGSSQTIVCTECGARWVPGRWADYLRPDARGLLSDLKTKKRRHASCLLDARGQVFRVRQDLGEAELAQSLATTNIPSRWPTRLRVFLVLIAVIGLAILVLIGSIISSGMFSLVFAAVFVACMGAVLLVVLRNARRQRGLRQLRQLARQSLEAGRCACCHALLDADLHPIDANACCLDCGLAFDADVHKRSHHLHQGIPDSEIESNPIFFSAS
jgi:hypothetical protein